MYACVGCEFRLFGRVQVGLLHTAVWLKTDNFAMPCFNSNRFEFLMF